MRHRQHTGDDQQVSFRARDFQKPGNAAFGLIFMAHRIELKWKLVDKVA
jgi:hypothetical protein